MDKRACDMCWWLLRDHVLQNRNLNDKEHSDDHEKEFETNDLSNVGFYQFFGWNAYIVASEKISSPFDRILL